MSIWNYLFGEKKESLEAALDTDTNGTNSTPRPDITETTDESDYTTSSTTEESTESETSTPTPKLAPVIPSITPVTPTSDPDETYKQLLKDATPESNEKIKEFGQYLFTNLNEELGNITIDDEEKKRDWIIASDLATAVKLRNQDLADYVIRHHQGEITLSDEKQTHFDNFIDYTKKQIIIGKGDDKVEKYKTRNTSDLNERDQTALEVLLEKAIEHYDRAESVITKADELIDSKELSLAQALLNQYDHTTKTDKKDIFTKQMEILEKGETIYNTATQDKLDENRNNVEVVRTALKSLDALLNVKTPYKNGEPTEDSKNLVEKNMALSKKANQDRLRVNVQEYINQSLAGEQDTDNQKIGAIFDTTTQISSEGLMTEYEKLKEEADTEKNTSVKIQKLEIAYALTPITIDEQRELVCKTNNAKEHFWNNAEYGKDLAEALIETGDYEKALGPINFSLTIARGLPAQGNKETGKRKGLVSKLTFKGYTAASNLAEQVKAQGQYEAADTLYEQALNMLGEHVSQQTEEKQKRLKPQEEDLINKYSNNKEAWANATAQKPASEITKSEIKNAFGYFVETSRDEQGDPHLEAIPDNIRERESQNVLSSIKYEFGKMNDVREKLETAYVLNPNDSDLKEMLGHFELFQRN
ncbi:MAG: hypothetical protein U9R08_06165 [Nanoarchaeota archaeon]|nr:hypothetical protein [Nanoarchaeota archaeon]